MNWKEWFERDVSESMVEESRYQMFKARLIDEVKVESNELLERADLIDLED